MAQLSDIDADHVDLPPEPPIERSEPRRLVGTLIVWVATAQLVGMTLRTPVQLEANDISRWCTVWSLVERGTYAIDECPWQHKTQDKVLRSNKLTEPGSDASLLRRVEYMLAPASWKEGEARDRVYSSKPPLLPTLIAGMLLPARLVTGVPLETMVFRQKREPRNVEELVEVEPGRFETRRRTDTERGYAEFPAYVYYFKPILLLWNVLPFGLSLVLYRRLLDRHAANDWTWFYCLFAAAWGTYLFAFGQTLNNHTVAAWSAFFAVYALIRIVADGRTERRYYAAAGFFAAFAAANEIPAALLTLSILVILLVRSPGSTLRASVPAAAIPTVAFLTTQLLAFGQFMPVYEEFGTRSYLYEGSYWATPLEFDAFNVDPEPWPVYLFHMTFGHHGIFSLTPIVLLAVGGLAMLLFEPRRRMRLIAALVGVMTAAMLAFYAWNPKARNYGGSTQGLRWLFWLFPLWLVVLPRAVEPGGDRRWYRILCLVVLAVSVMSVGYAIRGPWSHPWLVDLMVRLRWYALKF
ncbi:MAG: hypothetical protein KatS3mg108_2011 [Isosphaeraceae bacterium]|jgi:hypothetical protein|nr:MAG: hypothetical protein KatS3mg108_2011 [Isosphaeraceae bacterium]